MLADAGQEQGEEPGIGEDPDRLERTPRRQELQELGADALARQDGDAGPLAHGGGEAGLVRQSFRIFRMEAEEAQDAQVILADARRRVADEAHAPALEIGEAADMIVHGAVAAHRERVDGEVAAAGVGFEITPETDGGAAAVRLDVLAQGRHLERRALDHHRDGAVLDAGRHGLEARLAGARAHDRRRRRGGEVDLVHRMAEQRVAHGAADDARLLPRAVERAQDGVERRPPEQVRRCRQKWAA